MLHFFERNDLSPDDDLGINNNRTNKRINAVIAILKNIEKTQTKPTVAMLQSLFEQAEPPKKKLILEKNRPEKKEKYVFKKLKI